MRRLLLLLALLLTGCSGGGSTGIQGPITLLPTGGPPPVARPGTLAFSADWTAPLHVALRCGGPGLLTPFGCILPPDALWGVLPAPGNGGMDCVDPEPNVCFQPVGGVLGFHVSDGGMALVSAGTLDPDRPISLRAVISVTNNCAGVSGVSYAGPGIYGGGVDDGDPTGTYVAAYVSCAGPADVPKLWLYRPTYAGPVNSSAVSAGAHEVRIDYTPGQSFAIVFDGVQQMLVTQGSISNDAMTFPNAPHWALWFGESDGYVREFDVFTVP